MNLSFIVGLLLSLALVLFGMLEGNGSITIFLDLAGIMIVGGGTVGLLMASFKFKDTAEALRDSKLLFKKEKQYIAENYVGKLKEFAQEARQNGILALEERANQQDDLFLKEALLLVVDAVDSEKIRNSLSMSIEAARSRKMQSSGFYMKGSVYAPALGMAGTLLGLIRMLNNMSDYSQIGPNMSVALTATFYGCFFANVVFLPISSMITTSCDNEVFCKELVMEGVLDIQAGESPQYVYDKLSMMLERRKNNGGRR